MSDTIKDAANLADAPKELALRLRLPRIEDDLAVIGIAQVACEALLAVQLGALFCREGRKAEFEDIERQCRANVYWPDFCRLAKAGLVPENWLAGALGRVVLGWAKGGDQ